MAINLCNEAIDAGARKAQACEVLGVSERTLQRWQNEDELVDHRTSVVKEPKNKLSDDEKKRVLSVCNQPEYSSLPPSQIVPKLADAGEYIASESTMYRVFKESKQDKHRGNTKPRRTVEKPKGYCATGPNQVWSWDITYLKTEVCGLFYYLYLIVDVYSRKIVGWEVYDRELAELASEVLTRAYLNEGVSKDQIVLHSDNGSPMKGATMLATMQNLGVMPSLSRPSVSNDNPFSESLFRTLKTAPIWPEKPFESITKSREWTHTFATWYNNDHCHSGIQFVTPSQRHTGQDKMILKQRHEVYQAAQKRNPKRWSGTTRNWEAPECVWLNPPADTDKGVPMKNPA